MSQEKIYANRGLKSSVFEVAMTDATKHPWDEKQVGAATEYWTAERRVHARSVWMDTIPVVPPGATTGVIEVANYRVFLSVEHIADGLRSYATVVDGGAFDSTPLDSFINPVLFGDDYRPKLFYYDVGTTAWVEIPMATFDWQFDCASGVIITTGGALTASGIFEGGNAYWRLEAYRYVGTDLNTFALTNNAVGIVRDSGSATVVSNVNQLVFDDSVFAITDLGGGSAGISVSGSGSLTQFNTRDAHTIGAIPTVTINLAVPTKVFTANLALVYVNGLFAIYGTDYTITDSTNPANPTILNWTSATYSLQIGDVVTILY